MYYHGSGLGRGARGEGWLYSSFLFFILPNKHSCKAVLIAMNQFITKAMESVSSSECRFIYAFDGTPRMMGYISLGYNNGLGKCASSSKCRFIYAFDATPWMIGNISLGYNNGRVVVGYQEVKVDKIFSFALDHKRLREKTSLPINPNTN